MNEDDLPKQYNPSLTEVKWYDFWQCHGFFHADPRSDKPPYCLVLPPPNVTGILHMGHALVDTLQDVIARWRRMSGDEVLWLPGLDHAGISTQTVVERDLMAKMGKRRTDFDRKTFLSYVWKWKEKHGNHIIDQLKRLGCSCDWMRQRFTMDKEASLAVRTLFKKLFDDGLIYRGDYLVNWDPVTQTALADDEVEYEEKSSHLWYFTYPLEESEESVTIATTRPETLLGDVAIAVSPRDDRYRHLIGKRALLPIVNRSLPIIADATIDPKFGTGVVKITPAHDPNDYAIGLRHGLPMINLLNPDGTLNENGLEYEGLSFLEARKHIVSRMKEIGFLEKIEPHTHRVGVSYRSKAIIEPMLSKQWFIRMEPFKQNLIDIVKTGKVALLPKNWEKTYFHWIENLRDWCISRQLWWGHQIPIWYHKKDPEKILCYAGEGLPPEIQAEKEEWEQEEDVLDTWFSSALWPFSTLGWPHETRELKNFYPNATLITGHDILFFWVARMIAIGDYVMKKPPFQSVVLQGLIYGKSYFTSSPEGAVTYVSAEEKKKYDLGDPLPKEVTAKWEKMSKSKGNVIDPIEMITLYGADALRMALSASATQSRQIDLDRRRFEEFRHFANKIWNGARFVLMHVDLSTEKLMEGIDYSLLSLEDRWILSILNRVIQEMNDHLSHYQFDRFAMRGYTFFWDEFCAYYVEMTKPVLFRKSGEEKLRENKQKILTILLVHALLLMHPVAPFITEEIFDLLKKRFPKLEKRNKDPYTTATINALLSPACIVAPYPTLLAEEDIEEKIEDKFSQLRKVIHAVRQIRAEMGLPPHVASDLFFFGSGPLTKLIAENEPILTSLLPVYSVLINPEKSPKGLSSSTQVLGLTLTLPLPKEFAEKEKIRLKKEAEKIRASIASIESQLANPEFIQRAPEKIVNEKKEKLSSLRDSIEKMETKLQQ